MCVCVCVCVCACVLFQVGFLLHWESLLSTHGDEQGMLEDFIVAIADLNQLTFKVHSCYTPLNPHLSPPPPPQALLGRDTARLPTSHWQSVQDVCRGSSAEDRVPAVACPSAGWG